MLIASDGAAGPELDRWIASSAVVANTSESATALFDKIVTTQNGRPKDDVTIALMVRSEIPLSNASNNSIINEMSDETLESSISSTL
ncbi:MAG: hypothetical protein R2845_02870 [Thermomicrobiales bacterium]